MCIFTGSVYPSVALPMALYKSFMIHPLECKADYSATSNNMKLVHWPLVGVQRGGDWAGPSKPLPANRTLIIGHFGDDFMVHMTQPTFLFLFFYRVYFFTIFILNK